MGYLLVIAMLILLPVAAFTMDTRIAILMAPVCIGYYPSSQEMLSPLQGCPCSGQNANATPQTLQNHQLARNCIYWHIYGQCRYSWWSCTVSGQ
nr:hypothetical protein [Adonisia turfae]